jgi:DNA-binding transcriptional LysR family regulator
MELRQLERFIAIAEESSFTRAANRMHIVQSALTTSIQGLEAELGTALFVRSTRRVDLTESGKVFLVEARRALAAMKAAENAVKSVEGLLQGSLTLGIMNRFVSKFNVPSILGRFRSKHPGIQITVLQEGSSMLMGGVQKGYLDMAILGMNGPAPFGVSTTFLASDSLVAAFPESHPLANRKLIDLADLQDENFVDVQVGRALRATIDRAFAAANLHRKTVCDVSDISTVLDLISHGLGIGLVPQAATGYPAKIRYARIKPPVPTWDVAIAHMGAEPINPAARALLKNLLDHSQKAPRQK